MNFRDLLRDLPRCKTTCRVAEHHLCQGLQPLRLTSIWVIERGTRQTSVTHKCRDQRTMSYPYSHSKCSRSRFGTNDSIYNVCGCVKIPHRCFFSRYVSPGLLPQVTRRKLNRRLASARMCTRRSANNSWMPRFHGPRGNEDSMALEQQATI